MKEIIIKIFKSSIIAVTVLSFMAAPALQAVQIPGTLDQLNQGCSCCCCESPAEEKSCPVKSVQKSDRCGCEMEQPSPINSAPIVSIASNDNHKNSIVISALPQNMFDAPEVNFRKMIVKDDLPKKHPPIFILNSSFLI